ncbi:peptidoglycan DD-metalloendopeptidase family protein [Curtobacterium sp. 22159]|uniref:peptidoglycan DD-metalloendopeptidase family protein n=1 Tax=Curtobacterium sp. 22159 TaxID=3453882 RepID=UPI003F86BE65
MSKRKNTGRWLAVSTAVAAMFGGVVVAAPAGAATGDMIVPVSGTVTGNLVQGHCIDGSAHSGFDIAANSGTAIEAAAKGTVVDVRQSSSTEGYGTQVVIDHGAGYTSRYGHMIVNSPTVNVGQVVSKGQVIGKVGSTGHSTGPHLHFEVIIKGVAQSGPSSYFACGAKVTQGTPIAWSFPGFPTEQRTRQNKANKRYPSGPIGYNSSMNEEVFAIGSGGNVVNNFSTPGKGGGWNGWGDLGGSSNTKITVGTNAEGNEEVFAIGGGGAIFHKWFDPAKGWTAWSSLGGSNFTDMALSYNLEGNEVLYAIGGGGQMYQTWYDPSKGWVGWGSLGGSNFTDVTTGYNKNGEPEIFAIGAGGTMYHTWFTKGSGWNSWSSMGGSAFTEVTLGYNAAGNEELFAIGGGGVMYHAWFDPSSGWKGWDSLGGTNFTDVAVGYNASGNTDVIAIGGGGALFHAWYDPSNGWNGWSGLGGSGFQDVAVGYNDQDNEEVFAIGSNGQLYHTYSTPGQGTGWSGLYSMGGSGLRWE